jgi:fatty acid desaturase
MRPPNLPRLLLAYSGVLDMLTSIKTLFLNALGRLSSGEKDYIPETEWRKAILAARLHMVVYALTLAAAIVWQSWIPLMLIGLPRLYGCWHMVLTGLIQHCGLAENVTDHRLNSRTVYINPISRWLYWNMNYHVEHHMFPMVPYYALPKLHELIKGDLPVPNSSIWDAYKEAIPAVLRQAREPDYAFRKPLPSTAHPYMETPLSG